MAAGINFSNTGLDRGHAGLPGDCAEGGRLAGSQALSSGWRKVDEKDTRIGRQLLILLCLLSP